MPNRLAALVTILAALAGPPAAAAAAEPASPWRALAAQRFEPVAQARLQASGYTVAPAQVVWYSTASARAAGRPQPAAFYVNKPLTTYGGIEIARKSSAAAGDVPDAFELDGDAAIALFGVTPPPISYYSFTMNEFARYRPDTGRYVQTNSSIALSVNDRNIGTVHGNRFDDGFVLVVAAKFSAAQHVRDFFIAQGVPARSINTILVPHRFTRQSAERPSLLNLLVRLTYRTPAEKDQVAEYVQRDPPALRALHFEGAGAAGDVEDTDLVQWEQLLRDDRSEFAGSAAAGLDLLRTRVLQHLAALGYQARAEGVEELQHIDPDAMCRDVWRSCNYDTPDALYGNFLCGDSAQRCAGKLPGRNSRAVVIGVNHHRFGQDELMAYFSYAVTRLSDLQGIATLADVDTQGSAAAFLPDLENHDDFFVISVARDCNGEPYCLEIPYESQPGAPGLGRSELVKLTTRIYLDPIMGTAPNPANFVPARLFWLQK